MGWALALLNLVAIAVTVGMFGSNLVPLRNIRATKEWGVNKPAGVLGLLLGTTCWGIYGIVTMQPALLSTNGVGTIVAYGGLYVYAKHAPTSLDRRRLLQRAAFTVITAASAELLLYSGLIVQSYSLRLGLMGFIASCASIAMYGAPMVGIAEIVRTKDSSRLSLLILCFGFAVCAIWTVLGIAISDAMVIFSSAVGTAVNFFQICVCLVYPPKARLAAAAAATAAAADAAKAVDADDVELVAAASPKSASASLTSHPSERPTPGKGSRPATATVAVHSPLASASQPPLEAPPPFEVFTVFGGSFTIAPPADLANQAHSVAAMSTDDLPPVVATTATLGASLGNSLGTAIQQLFAHSHQSARGGRSLHGAHSLRGAEALATADPDEPQTVPSTTHSVAEANGHQVGHAAATPAKPATEAVET